MSFYNMCIVLAIFLTQLFVIESYAKETNNIKLVTLTAKEIQALPAQQKIEYIKKLRELAEATEETQNAFYGPALYANSNKLINQFLQHILISEAWAVDDAKPKTCIIAGNIGELHGRICRFTKEQKENNANCKGKNQWACNPALYGEGVCIDIVKDATAACNEQDLNLEKVLAKYKSDTDTYLDNNDYALKQLVQQADSIFENCKKTNKTSDQEKTCKKLEDRIALVGKKACDAIGAKQEPASGANQSQEARIKSCEETVKKIAKDLCESKASQLEEAAEKLNKACGANGFKTGTLVSPACYPELDKCKKNGYSDKCFSSNEALEMDKIEKNVDTIRVKLNSLVDSAKTALRNCFPETEPNLNRSTMSSAKADAENYLAYQDYKKFSNLEKYTYKDDKTLQSGLSSSKSNVEDQRKYWQVYLNEASSDNERVIRAIEARLGSCKDKDGKDVLTSSEKAAALNKLSALRAYNEQMANEFRHSKSLVTETKDKQPGMLDANDILTKNKREIEQWFISPKDSKSGTFDACCLSPGKNGEASPLHDGKHSKWCNKSNSGLPSRIYQVPSPPEGNSGQSGDAIDPVVPGQN